MMDRHIYSIPSHSSFGEALARGLVHRFGQDPVRFSQGVVLVTDSGVKPLIIEAFRGIGDDLPLPRLISLGDDDPEEPIVSLLEGASVAGIAPAVAPVLRRLMLAELLHAAGVPVDNAEAIRLGGFIASTIDEVHAGELSPDDALGFLASEGEALQPGRSVAIVRDVMERWQATLMRWGRIDPVTRRGRVLELLARQWIERPPDHFVCVADAGNPGYPAARLLRVIAELPKGLVVLPGLSLVMDDDDWSALEMSLERWRGGPLSAPSDRWRAESSRPQKQEKARPPVGTIHGHDEILQALGIARAATVARPGASGPAAVPDGTMRFQANPVDPHSWGEEEYDAWLAGQPTTWGSGRDPRSGRVLSEDNAGDHYEDWADDPEEAMGGLEPFDPAWDGDDPDENQEEVDDFDPDGAYVSAQAAHPQHQFRILLQRMGISRNEVQPWHRSSAWRSPPARSRAIDHAFTIPTAMAMWPHLSSRLRRFKGIRAVEAASPAQEALAIASAMREAGATPGMTAALLTPDRDLVRRVIAICTSWRLDLVDRVGEPLSSHPAGTLLLAIAQVVGHRPSHRGLRTLIEHPLVHTDDNPQVWSDGLRALERLYCAPLAYDGQAGIEELLIRHRPAGCSADAIGKWWRRLDAILAPLADMAEMDVLDLPDILTALCDTAEALAGPGLWESDAGKVAKNRLMEFARHGREAGTRIEVASLATTLRALLEDGIVGPTSFAPAQVCILSPKQARVHTPGLMIVAGLNERTWPSAPAVDPLLGERLRAEAGLPSLFGQAGLWAHALVQALGAPHVLLTRSLKDHLGPTQPSQHWLRLQTLSGGLVRADPLGDRPNLVGQRGSRGATAPADARRTRSRTG